MLEFDIITILMIQLHWALRWRLVSDSHVGLSVACIPLAMHKDTWLYAAFVVRVAVFAYCSWEHRATAVATGNTTVFGSSYLNTPQTAGQTIVLAATQGAEEVLLQPAEVVSSWVLVAVLSSLESSSEKTEPHKLVAEGLRDGIASSLGVCRTAVNIVSMEKTRMNYLVDPFPRARKHFHQHYSLLHRLQQLVRRGNDQTLRHVNITRARAVYEVRIFQEMRLNASEIAMKIDRLQIYSHFSGLGQWLARTLVQGATFSVVLDDVGYASRQVLPRSAMTRREVMDCFEEGLLRDARIVHQYVLILAVILIILTICVGSAVFTMKHPSSVPSRLNPLVRPNES